MCVAQKKKNNDTAIMLVKATGEKFVPGIVYNKNESRAVKDYGTFFLDLFTIDPVYDSYNRYVS